MGRSIRRVRPRRGRVVVIIVLQVKQMPNVPQAPRTSRDVIRNVMEDSETPLPLDVVEQRLARSGYVAFGAEPIDAIDSAIESGLLKFNASDNTLKWTG